MNFALLVTGPVYGTQQSASAYQFAQAVLAKGHTIIGVFFYQAGVTNANMLTSAATDEYNMHEMWGKFADTHNITLHTCVAAAQRRGILDSITATEGEKQSFNVAPPFLLSGLGQLAEMLLTADRVVQF